jgi:hypothetical protein
MRWWDDRLIQRERAGQREYLEAALARLHPQLIHHVETLEQWARDDARCPGFCSAVEVLAAEINERLLCL